MKIDEKTTVPLFSVIASLAVIVGMVYWLAAVGATASQALDEVQRIEKKQTQYDKDITTIKVDIGIIKERLPEKRAH